MKRHFSAACLDWASNEAPRSSDCHRRCNLLVEVCDEKLNQLHSRCNTVFLFAKSVALVREQDVLNRHAAAFEVLDDLLCLDDRDVRVVCAMLDHQRRLDPIQLPER